MKTDDDLILKYELREDRNPRTVSKGPKAVNPTKETERFRSLHRYEQPDG